MARVRARAVVPVCAVALLLVALGAGSAPLLSAQRGGGLSSVLPVTRTEREARPLPAASLPPGTARTTSGSVPDLRPVLVATVVVLLLALVAVAVLLVRGRGLPRPRRRAQPERPTETRAPGPAQHEEETEQLRAAVGRARGDLTAGGDPRQLVLRAWSRLEAAVAATGHERATGETSAELTRRVLHEHTVRARPLTDLHTLYQAARYSARPVDPGAAARTDALLREVQEDLAGA